MKNDSIHTLSVLADQRAKIRDVEVRKNDVDLAIVNEQDEKAHKKGLRIVREKDINKADFTMTISDNMKYIFHLKSPSNDSYLSTAQIALIYQLSWYVEMGSNIITKEDGDYYSLSELCELFGYSRCHLSVLINGLISKGVLYEVVGRDLIKNNRVIGRRALIINPEIIYRGDRNKINATLARIVINGDILEKQKIKLPWKVWMDIGANHGRLYRRSTYLDMKKKTKNGKT